MSTNAIVEEQPAPAIERQSMEVDIACAGFGPAMGGFLTTLTKEWSVHPDDPAFMSKAVPGMPLQVLCYERADDLAAGVTGRNGYILELEAHSPHAGSVGIQNSQRLAESVERYLVTEHQIPVYRMHFVALGNAEVASVGSDETKPKRISDVHVRLMANSLAAQGAASPQGVAPSTGADRP